MRVRLKHEESKTQEQPTNTTYSSICRSFVILQYVTVAARIVCVWLCAVFIFVRVQCVRAFFYFALAMPVLCWFCLRLLMLLEFVLVC